MFEGGSILALLHALYISRAHGAAEDRVAAIGLRKPAPAQIPRHIDHRRKCMSNTHCVHLAAVHFRHALYQLRRKGCSQSNRHGKLTGAADEGARESLTVEEHRDFVWRMLQHIGLDPCDLLSDLTRRSAHDGHGANAIFQSQILRVMQIGGHHACQLKDLFLRAHLSH